MQTVRVRRGNVVLSVPVIDKDNYLAKGFDVLDEKGAVVQECIPNDVPTLQAKVSALMEENKRLKEELAKKTTPAKTKAVKSEDKPVTEEAKKVTKKTK